MICFFLQDGKLSQVSSILNPFPSQLLSFYPRVIHAETKSKDSKHFKLTLISPLSGSSLISSHLSAPYHHQVRLFVDVVLVRVRVAKSRLTNPEKDQDPKASSSKKPLTLHNYTIGFIMDISSQTPHNLRKLKKCLNCKICTQHSLRLYRHIQD